MRCTPKSDCFQEKERYANGSVKKACTLQFQCRGPVHDLDRSRNWRSDFGGSECSLGRPGTILNCITEGEEAEWVRTYFGNMGACRGKYEPSPGQGQEGTKQCPSEFKNDESGSSTANEKFNSNLREYYKRNRRVKRDLESIPSCSSFGKEKEKCPFQQLREDCGEIGKSSRSKKRSTVNMGFSNDTNGKLAIQLPAYMKELTLAINMERHRAKARVIRLSHRLNLCAKMCNHDLVQKTNECDMMDVLKQLGYKANKAQQFIRVRHKPATDIVLELLSDTKNNCVLDSRYADIGCHLLKNGAYDRKWNWFIIIAEPAEN